MRARCPSDHREVVMSAQRPFRLGEPDPRRVETALDDALALVESGRVHDGMELLVGALRDRRARLSPSEWRRWVAECVETHPIASVAREDPFTGRAFRKPRGYAGDAVLMDDVYGVDRVEASSPRAAAIHRFTTNGPAARAVRHRRQLVASLVDEAAAERAGARVLSIGCGHVREAEISSAVREGRLGELVGVDHDREALAVAGRAYGRFGFRPEHGSLLAILSGEGALRGFDLVYATGLFDALAAPAARRLAETM